MATNEETAAPGASDSSELETKAVRGASWTIATGLASRAVGLVGTLVLTHYLSPDVIGQTSNAVILIVFAHQISTLGITQYLVARPDSPREVTWHVSLIYLAAGALAIGAMGLFGRHLSGVLESPDLGLYLPGMAISGMIDRVIFIPERMLVRKIQFRTMSLWRAVADMIYSGTSIALAMRGFGGYSIVIANIARGSFYSIGILRATQLGEWLSPSRFDLKIVKKLFAFGLPLWVGTSASAMARRWDNLLISSMFGVSTVGAYNLAYNLAELPAGYIGLQIGDVLMPAFAQMDATQRRVAIVKATGVLAIVVFPLALGLGAIAPTLVTLFLGMQWVSVAPMLMILSGLAVSSPIGWTISAYFQTIGRTTAVLVLEVFKVVTLLTLMALLGHFGGPLWACSAVPLAFLLYALSSLWMVHRVDEVSFAALIGICVPPLLACVPMIAAIFALRSGWEHAGLHLLPLRLALELVLGGIVYVATAFVVARSAAREFVSHGKRFLGRRSAATPPS